MKMMAVDKRGIEQPKTNISDLQSPASLNLIQNNLLSFNNVLIQIIIPGPQDPENLLILGHRAAPNLETAFLLNHVVREVTRSL